MQTAGTITGRIPVPMDCRSMIIVEDEPLIAMMIESMAIDLGWDVAWIAHDEASAFDLLNSTPPPSVAVLDVNLKSATSFAVASACKDRGIPVLFTTGYTAMQVPDECSGAPVLAKPFSPEDFEIALGRCFTRDQPAA